MFRALLEQIVRAKGSSEAVRILDSKGPAKIARAIDQMATDHAITPQMQEWAHEIRVVGNDGGHWDPLSDVTRQDALAIAELSGGLVDYLFVMPAKMAARRASPDRPPP